MNSKTKVKRAAALCLLVCMAAALFAGCGAQPQTAAITSVEQFAAQGLKLGVLVGPLMEDAAAEFFPDSEYFLYNSYPDCVAALLADKIDGFLIDEPGIISIRAETPEIDYIHDRMTENNYSFAFRKDDPESAALCAQLNEFLAKCRADGTMDEIAQTWLGTDESKKVVDTSGLTGENGTVRVATTSTDMPWSYVKDGKNVGYDIDLVVRFCRAYGYTPELGDMDFAARIPAVQAGKYDFSTDMNVTPEREEQVLFSDPTAYGGIVLAVRAEDLAQQGTAAAAVAYTDLDELNGKKIGVLTGSIHDALVKERLPDAQIEYFLGTADMSAALKAGRIDSFVVPGTNAAFIRYEDGSLTWLDDHLTDGSYGFAFAKSERGRELNESFSGFIRSIKNDGRLDALLGKWFGNDESVKTIIDYASLPDTNGTLHMATDGMVMPYVYVKDGIMTGLETELAALFCQENGYRLQVDQMNFDGILPAVMSGKCDFAVSCLSITPERQENVDFSESYYTDSAVFMVLASGAAAEAVPEYSEFTDLSGKTVSMLTGAPFEELVKSKAPDVGEFTSYASTPDMLLALKAGKTDAMLTNNAIGQLAVNRDSGIALFPQSLQDGVFGFAFAKGSPERDAWQAALDAIPEETKQAVWEKWTGSDESAKVVPEQDWPGENGTVRVAACDTLEPMSYAGEGGELMGFDIEMILLIARELDVHVEFEGMDFSAILACVQSGKALVGAGSVIVTEERRQAVDFVEYRPASFVLVVRAAGDGSAAAETDGSFLASVADSFEKTFIRENRWKLFLAGIGTTLLITVLSVILGTALGYAVFMLCRNGNPVANTVTRFCVWLVQGMPVVVLLMILCYVVFGKVAISGTIVSVIGFTLIFGAAVFAMMKAGVGAVDPGQREAAYSLGYTDRRAFYRVVLPQALPHFLPAYKGEITALIKATAVVGYVAVQDLTKIGDIVRSRTYEAFFPLIAVAVIYFILAAILTFAVNRLSVRIDPRRRPKKAILKGVESK